MIIRGCKVMDIRIWKSVYVGDICFVDICFWFFGYVVFYLRFVIWLVFNVYVFDLINVWYCVKRDIDK